MAEVTRETRLPEGGWEIEFQFDRDWVRDAISRTGAIKPIGCGVLGVVLAFPFLSLIGRDRDGLPINPWMIPPLLIIGWFAYQSRRKAIEMECDGWEAQSPSAIMRFRIDDEFLTVLADYGETRHPIQNIEGLKRFPDTWVIDLPKQRKQLFPGEVSDDVQEYFISRCERAGVEVKE